MCVFIWRLGRWVLSDYNDSVFCKEETSTAIGMIKEKKRLTCKTEKKSKDKKSSKIQPAPVLVRMFWGRFRTRSDSIGHARGRFRTRSDSIGRASQRPWTRLDEWPDPVRSRPASDTFPDPSPESDSSRFVRSLNLPIDGNGLLGHRLIDSRWFEKNPPTESGWKRRSKKNAHVPAFRAEMLVTQYPVCAFKFAPSRHAFDLHTFLRLTRALCRSLVAEGSVVRSCFFFFFVKL